MRSLIVAHSVRSFFSASRLKVCLETFSTASTQQVSCRPDRRVPCFCCKARDRADPQLDLHVRRLLARLSLESASPTFCRLPGVPGCARRGSETGGADREGRVAGLHESGPATPVTCRTPSVGSKSSVHHSRVASTKTEAGGCSVKRIVRPSEPVNVAIFL
jgi:hypothetical protein